MTKNLKATLTVVAVVAAVLVAALLLTRPTTPDTAVAGAPAVPADVLVREDSHRLNTTRTAGSPSSSSSTSSARPAGPRSPRWSSCAPSTATG